MKKKVLIIAGAAAVLAIGVVTTMVVVPMMSGETAGANTAYVTKVQATVSDADAFMVNLDENPDWVVADTSEDFTDKDLHFNFVTYKRK